MDRPVVHLEMSGSACILTLDFPPGNFLPDPEFISPGKLHEYLKSHGAKSLIIRGVGKHFSGGAELDSLFDLARKEDLLSDRMERGKSLLEFIENLDIPVIAAISGICFGGGLEIALACHIRICSDNALFAFPEANQSLMPGLGGTVRLPAKISWAKSLEMVLGGDMLNAWEALDMKIVDEVLSRDEYYDRALRLAEKMTKERPEKVVRYILQAMRNARSLKPADAMKEETRMFCELASDEAERRKHENSL